MGREIPKVPRWAQILPIGSRKPSLDVSRARANDVQQPASFEQTPRVRNDTGRIPDVFQNMEHHDPVECGETDGRLFQSTEMRLEPTLLEMIDRAGGVIHSDDSHRFIAGKRLEEIALPTAKLQNPNGRRLCLPMVEDRPLQPNCERPVLEAPKKSSFRSERPVGLAIGRAVMFPQEIVARQF